MGNPPGALRELATCAGGPRALARKTRALAATLWAYVRPTEPRRRMERLQDLGLLADAPTMWQVHAGALHMLLRYKLKFAPLFYNQRGKPPMRHVLMRLLDEPAGMIDPSGLHAPMEAVISHTIQVAHHDATYDVEILRTFPEGVEALRDAVRLVLEGRHPRQHALEAIVEDPDYHKRLLEAAERHLAEPDGRARLTLTPPPPGGEAIYARFAHFHALSTFLAYCATLPRTPLESLRWALQGRRAGL